MIWFLLSLILLSSGDEGVCTTDKCSSGHVDRIKRSVATSHVSPVERCREILKRKELTALSGTVGMGWDNLQNLPMANVFEMPIDACLTTPDGLFLIADDMEIFPIKAVDIETSAEFYEHWLDFFESNSYSINIEAGATFSHWGFSGSFSSTSQNTKGQFVSKQSSLLHSKIVYRGYTVLVQSLSRLHSSLKQRLFDVHRALKEGYHQRAKYMAEEIVRDYGTHVITRAELGARIAQEIYVERDIKARNETHFNEIKAAASASFLSSFSAKVSYTTTSSEQTRERLEKSTRHSRTETTGRPNVNRLLTSDANGTQSIEIDDLVVTDYGGVPIFTIINEHSLPELTHDAVTRLSRIVQDAAERYYRENERTGCLDPKASNFDYLANTNASCEISAHNQTIGGVFQKCKILPRTPKDFYFLERNPKQLQMLCEPYLQKNHDTADFSCGDLYEAVPLLKTVYQLTDVKQRDCQDDCDNWLFWENCDTECRTIHWKYDASVESYYCRAKANVEIPKEHGYLFGGLYVQNQTNLFTGSSTCPGLYQPYLLFRNTFVCLSQNYAVDADYEIQLDRFFTCQSKPDDAKCSKGYTQHLATTENDCSIFFCVKPEQLRARTRVRIKRPPFEAPSTVSNETENMVAVYSNNTLLMRVGLAKLVWGALNASNQAQRKQPFSLKEEQAANDPATITEKQLDSFIFDTYIPAFEKLQAGEHSQASNTIHKKAAKEGLSTGNNNFLMIVAGMACLTILSIIVAVMIWKRRSHNQNQETYQLIGDESETLPL